MQLAASLQPVSILLSKTLHPLPPQGLTLTLPPSPARAHPFPGGTQPTHGFVLFAQCYGLQFPRVCSLHIEENFPTVMYNFLHDFQGLAARSRVFAHDLILHLSLSASLGT